MFKFNITPESFFECRTKIAKEVLGDQYESTVIMVKDLTDHELLIMLSGASEKYGDDRDRVAMCDAQICINELLTRLKEGKDNG